MKKRKSLAILIPCISLLFMVTVWNSETYAAKLTYTVGNGNWWDAGVDVFVDGVLVDQQPDNSLPACYVGNPGGTYICTVPNELLDDGQAVVRFNNVGGVNLWLYSFTLANHETVYPRLNDGGISDGTTDNYIIDQGAPWIWRYGNVYMQYTLDINLEKCSVSYIIYISGNTIYAKDGSTGEIRYSGTDATTVIQNAINDLGASGGLVAIKKGTYTLTNTVTIPSKVAIVGEGAATKITIQNNFGQNYASIFKSQSLSSDISIKDIWIDGNKANQIYLIRGIGFDTGTEGIKVTGVKITNSKGAGIITGAGCKRIIVESCDISGVDGDGGIWIGGASANLVYDVVVKGNIIKSSSRGVVAAYAQDVMIIGNRCVSFNTGDDCIIVDQCSEEIIIEGNICRDGGEGIMVHNTYPPLPSKKVNIIGNTVINMSRRGITVTPNGTDDVLIEGNYVLSTAWNGISIEGEQVKNSIVSGNTVIDADTGIAMVVASDSAIVTNNICTLNKKSGISFNAPKGIVTNNICYNNNVAQNIETQHQNGISIVNCLKALVRGNSCYDDRVTKLQEYGIWLGGQVGNIYIFKNNCVGNKTGSISPYDWGGANIIKDNIGYKTENSGIANVSNGGTIAHGLVATPTFVQLTVKSTSTTKDVSYNANSTNIIVYYNGGGPIDVAWHAEVQ